MPHIVNGIESFAKTEAKEVYGTWEEILALRDGAYNQSASKWAASYTHDGLFPKEV